MNLIDNYSYSNGFKNVNNQFKFLFVIFTMLISLISTSPIIPLLVTLLIFVLLIFFAKIPLKFYFKLMCIPLAFGLLNLIFMSLFFGLTDPWFNLGIFNIIVYKDGFNLGFLLFCRMMGGFSCMAFLILTTPMNELFHLAENMKIPKVVTEIAMLMYRYIFVFMEESENMYNAQKTRLGYNGIKNSFQSLGLLISNLFIRTWFKGEQAYVSMESRCYNGSINSLKSDKKLGIKNILILVSFECLLLLGTYLTWGFNII